MDKEIIFIVEEDSDGGFSARALGHSIFTQADTRHELKTRLEETLYCHFGEYKVPYSVKVQ